MDQGQDRAKGNVGAQKGKQKQVGFDFSKDVNGGNSKVTSKGNPKDNRRDIEGIPLGNSFTGLERNEEGGKGSEVLPMSGKDGDSVIILGGPSTSVPECTTSREVEMDLGRILPASVLNSISGAAPATNNISEYKKSRISGYITHTKDVPTMIANSWDMDEWNFFTNQCAQMGYEPDNLIVDNASFMEDNLFDVKGSPHVPKNKKHAISKALNSNAKTVKAKNMAAWSEQVDRLGIDMTYAVEDVEQESNGMMPLWQTNSRLYGFGPGAFRVSHFVLFFGAWFVGGCPDLPAVCAVWLFFSMYRGWCYLMWKGNAYGDRWAQVIRFPCFLWDEAIGFQAFGLLACRGLYWILWAPNGFGGSDLQLGLDCLPSSLA
ncbi:hypothetical protein R6Q59_028593 [Mikania micrantha]